MIMPFTYFFLKRLLKLIKQAERCQHQTGIQPCGLYWAVLMRKTTIYRHINKSWDSGWQRSVAYTIRPAIFEAFPT
jgi:hypothetical protein